MPDALLEPSRPTTASAPTSATPARHPRRWAILAVLCLSLFVVTLDNTVLNVALPSLVSGLGLSAPQVQWVVDAYSLVFAGLLLAGGSIGDRHGRRRALLAGLAVFGAGSTAAALAGSASALIVARGVMGVGGALLMPATLAIVMHVFEADERPRAIAVWGGVSALGVSAGPVLGGLLVERFWWGSVFLVNVPVVLLAVVAAVALVPESRRGDAPRPDLLGALLSSTAIVAAVWATIQVPEHGWVSVPVLAAGGVAVVLAGGFVSWERRCAAPMLRLSLLRSRQLIGASSVGVLLMFSLAGATFVLTQHLQLTLGFSPLEAGVRTLPVAGAILVTSSVSPAFATLVGNHRAVATGLALLAGGLSVVALTAAREEYWPVALGCVLLGAGIGLAMAPASSSLMSSFPRDHAGLGSAMNDTFQELGAALGVAVLGGIATATYRSGLPTSVPEAARDSYGAALALARGEGTTGVGLAGAARSAFDLAVQHSLVGGSVTALLGAVVGLLVLGRRAVPVEPAATP
ncbi:MAG: MFS transporter [Micrococcales bacterium]|nr:MFS transporter [Micrococcales bacterium]